MRVFPNVDLSPVVPSTPKLLEAVAETIVNDVNNGRRVILVLTTVHEAQSVRLP